MSSGGWPNNVGPRFSCCIIFKIPFCSSRSVLDHFPSTELPTVVLNATVGNIPVFKEYPVLLGRQTPERVMTSEQNVVT